MTHSTALASAESAATSSPTPGLNLNQQAAEALDRAAEVLLILRAKHVGNPLNTPDQKQDLDWLRDKAREYRNLAARLRD